MGCAPRRDPPNESRGPPCRSAPPCALASLPVAGLATLVLAAPATVAIQDLPVPTPDSGLDHVVAAKVGSLRFSEQQGFKVGRITTAGQITEWTIPADGEFGPEELTVAADGRVWVLSDAHGKVFVVDPAVPGAPGTGYDLTGGQLGGRRGNDIAAAPDGTVWITDNLSDGVVRVRPDGTAADTRGGPPQCDFDGILAAGPDGRMWCADNTSSGDALKRTELDGVTSTSLPMGSGFSVGALAAGPGDAMWFGRYSAGSYAFKPGRGSVGRMATDGGVEEWPVGDKVAPASLAAGPDGAMWFGSIGSDAVVGRVTPAGEVTTLPLGVRRANDVAFGGDGALWFLDQNANRITRMTRDEVVKGGGGGPAPAGTPTVPAGTLRATKGRIPVRVACPKATADRCRGTVRLRTAAKVQIGGHGRKALRTLTAAGRYTLSPGKTGTIRVKLWPTGGKVVRKDRTTKVVVEVTPTGAKQVAARRTVKLRG